jgi:hypothetical protein
MAATWATSASTLAAADLELEDLVAALGQHALGFVDVLGGVARWPGSRRSAGFAGAAAKQLRDRQAGALAQASKSAVSMAHLAKRLP